MKQLPASHWDTEWAGKDPETNPLLIIYNHLHTHCPYLDLAKAHNSPFYDKTDDTWTPGYAIKSYYQHRKEPKQGDNIPILDIHYTAGSAHSRKLATLYLHVYETEITFHLKGPSYSDSYSKLTVNLSDPNYKTKLTQVIHDYHWEKYDQYIESLTHKITSNPESYLSQLIYAKDPGRPPTRKR